MPRGDGGYKSRLDVRALYKHDPRTRRALWAVFLAPLSSAAASLALGVLAACLAGLQVRPHATYGYSEWGRIPPPRHMAYAFQHARPCRYAFPCAQPRYTASWAIMAAEALACAALYAVEAAAVGASTLGSRHSPHLVRLAHDPHVSVRARCSRGTWLRV